MGGSDSIRLPLVAIGLISAGACAFLFWLLYFREAESSLSDQLAFLPAVNAGLNAASAVCLVLGFRAIRARSTSSEPLREIAQHRRFMIAAFALSSAFLVGYITHHALHGDTRFQGEGGIKVFYLSVLASHVLLSVVALPLVLTTFFLSLTGRFDRHRRLARWTFPIWLYVSVTGVMVFAMLETLSH